MRVILEMTDSESRTVTVERHFFPSHEPTQAAAMPAASGTQNTAPQALEDPGTVPDTKDALDAGAPSTELLVALGASEVETTDHLYSGGAPGETHRRDGTSAGAAPDWLKDILSRTPG